MTYPFAINPFSIPWKISSWRFFSNPDEKNLFWQLPVPTSGSFVCLSIYSYKVIVFRLAMLLSQFSRVRLYATPETAAHQAPPSLGFSRQKHWSGLPFPSPMQESEKWKWSHSVVFDPQRLQPSRLLSPWDVPGKSTGVGCLCLLR